MIHGIWLGDRSPSLFSFRCVGTWPAHRRWTAAEEIEDNAPVLRDMAYWRAALGAKCWAAASDVARLAILWHHGGIYLDHDVEVIDPTGLLSHQFYAFEQGKCLLGEESPDGDVCGAVMIAPPMHPFVGRMLRVYLQKGFEPFDGRNDNGTKILTTQARSIQDPVGRRVEIQHQACYYPWSWKNKDAPDDWRRSKIVRDLTVAIHHWEGSWVVER